MAVSGLADFRQAANEAATRGNLDTLHSAQAQYRTANGLYAGSLATLESQAYLPPGFGSGELDGYTITMTVVPGSYWSATANPSVPYASGTPVLFIDQTGSIQMRLRSADGVQREIVVPPVHPITLDSGSAFDRALLEVGTGLIYLLDKLYGDNAAVQGASGIAAQPGVLGAVLAELDINHDGSLTFDEILTVDLLTVARNLVPTLVGTDGSPSVGDDDALGALLSAYQSAITSALGLDLGLHETLPPAPVAVLEASGNANDLLVLLTSPLTDAQQRCVNVLNRKMLLLVLRGSKGVHYCMAEHNLGRIIDIESCVGDLALTAKGRIAKAFASAERSQAAFCAGKDPQGITEAPFVFARSANGHYAVAAALGERLLSAVYGDDVAAAAIDRNEDAAASKCQEAVAQALTTCQSTLVGGSCPAPRTRSRSESPPSSPAPGSPVKSSRA
jgi:type II secretory pathway pseudopilin PulG